MRLVTIKYYLTIIPFTMKFHNFADSAGIERKHWLMTISSVRKNTDKDEENQGSTDSVQKEMNINIWMIEYVGLRSPI